MSKHNVSALDRGGLYELISSSYLQLPTMDNVSQTLNALVNAEKVFSDIDFSKLIFVSSNRKAKLSEDPNFIKELEQDYYDHFLVPITSFYIPPYESSLLGATKTDSKEGRKNKGGWKYNRSSSLVDYNVHLAYDSVGFNPKDMNIIKELKHENKMDHIGFEVGFMAFLCNMEANAFSYEVNELNSENNKNSVKWYNLQTQFLRDHLRSFIQTYDKISQEKAKPFYRDLLEVLKFYIDWDLRFR